MQINGKEGDQMKSLLVKLGIFLLLFLTFGCSSIYMGQPISTIVDSRGTPTRVIPDGRGGSVYIWEQWVGDGYGGRHLWETMFWVDSKGIIYK
jgi:hypothetical protein